MTTKAQAMEILGKIGQLRQAAEQMLSEHLKMKPQTNRIDPDKAFLQLAGQWENERAKKARAVEFLTAKQADLEKTLDHYNQCAEAAQGLELAADLHVEDTLGNAFRKIKNMEAARTQKQNPDDAGYQWLKQEREEMSLEKLFPVNKYFEQLGAGTLGEGETL